MVEVHSSSHGPFVRLQIWHGDPVKGPMVCASAHITMEQAEKLIEQVRGVLSTMPRVGTPADLGCEVL